MFVFHTDRKFALTLALAAVLTDDDAAEDFDLGEVVGGVGGIGVHGKLEIFFITRY